MPKTSTREVTKETILVEKASEWGPLVNGNWYGVNDPVEGTDFKPGKTYDVLVVLGKPTPKYPNGKKYINQIVNESTQALEETQTAKKSDKNETHDASKEKYWQDKNDSQKLGGLFHDAAQLTAAMVMANGNTSADEVINTFEQVLEGVINARKKLD